MSGDDLTLFALGHVKGLDSGEQKGSGANGVVNEVTVNGVACIAFTRHSRLEKVSYQHKFAAECSFDPQQAEPLQRYPLFGEYIWKECK